jgi:hypothetical protein
MSLFVGIGLRIRVALFCSEANQVLCLIQQSRIHVHEMSKWITDAKDSRVGSSAEDPSGGRPVSVYGADVAIFGQRAASVTNLGRFTI